MAIPNELFRVWTFCELQDSFGAVKLYEWVSVWYVLCTDPLADPADVAVPFAAWINAGVTQSILSDANVVVKYGGKNVAAGGPDVEVITGNLPVGPPDQLLPPQVSVLVLGQSLRPRHQTRKWVGGGKQNWIEGTTGKVKDDDAGFTAWLREANTQKVNGALVIQPVVWDPSAEEVHEIQNTAIMRGFRTQRRRSLAEEGQF